MEMEMKMEMERHVAVMGFPTHERTLFKLLRRLAAAAPTTIFSVFNTSQANSNITVVNQNLRLYDVADGMPEHLEDSISATLWGRADLFMKATPGNFRYAIQMAEAEIGMKISCLLTDVYLWFAADMAQELGVPWVAIRTAALYSLSIYLYTDAIREVLGVGGPPWLRQPPENQTLDFIIPGLSAVKVKDLPEGIVFGDFESVFPSLFYKLGLTLPQATAVVTNCFEELEPTIVTDNLKRTKLQKVFQVGPFELLSPPPLISDVDGCLPWLDKRKEASVAYVCFGSIITPPPTEIVALAEALEATGIPFLWSLKEHAMEEYLPKGFLERTADQGKVVSWAPQPRVLAHDSVAVFITHSGWNSVIESIIGGVPMICRPFVGDQLPNKRMVEDVWGIGVGIEGGILTKSGVVRALGLISSDEWKEMKKKIRVLKELARKAIEPNGASTQNFNALVELITSTCKVHLDTNHSAAPIP